jgi:diguanylate cyclase (GGDEF)-like protein
MRRKLNREYEERQKMEAHLKHLSTHDPLTDLPTRAMFDEFLKSAIARAKRQGEGLAVMMIDIKNFKSINEKYEHNAGDFVLKEFAYRLNRSLRSTDQVARVGGDEFIAFIEGSTDQYIIARICERLMYNANQPFVYKDQELHISISIGISRYPDDADNIPDLIRLADLAMVEVKQTQDHIYHFYSTENADA